MCLPHVPMHAARGAGARPQPGKVLRPELQDYTTDFHRARQDAMLLPFSKMHRRPGCVAHVDQAKATTAPLMLDSEGGRTTSTSTSTAGTTERNLRHKSIFVDTSHEHWTAHELPGSATA